MNCTNCAAPLIWAPGSRALRCEHCGTFRPLELDPAWTDRVSRLNLPANHTCPQCRAHLEQVVIDGLSAESCVRCHGLLLADDAFAQLVRQRRAAFRGAETAVTPLDPDRLQRQLPCPGCDRLLEVHTYCGPGNQVVDSCYPCGLVWLDSGELWAIETAPGQR